MEPTCSCGGCNANDVRCNREVHSDQPPSSGYASHSDSTVTLRDLQSKHPDVFTPLLAPLNPTGTITIPENNNIERELREWEQEREGEREQERKREEEREQRMHETRLSIATFINSVAIPGGLSTVSFHPAGSRSRSEDIQFYFFLVSYLLAVLLSLAATLLYLCTPVATIESRGRLGQASQMTVGSLVSIFVAFILSLMSLDDTTQSIVVAAISGVFLLIPFLCFLYLKYKSRLSLP